MTHAPYGDGFGLWRRIRTSRERRLRETQTATPARGFGRPSASEPAIRNPFQRPSATE